MSTALSKMEKSQIEFLLRDNNDPAVAKQFGVTRQAVYAIRKKFGIASSRRSSNTRKNTILTMRREGVPIATIASSLHMSQSYVYKVLRQETNGKSRAEPTV